MDPLIVDEIRSATKLKGPNEGTTWGSAMNYHFRNLVFEGGGVKGIAYVGALKELERKKILDSIDRVGGTSAGAINAVLLALGYSIENMNDILWSLDFNKFMDDDAGLIRDVRRLTSEYGWHKGDYFRDWIGDLIKRKTGSSETTFIELNRRAKAGNRFANCI